MTSSENELEQNLIEKLRNLKYEYREDIRDRAALEQNFREKFESLNRVRLTDAEFAACSSEIPPIIPRYDLYVAKADWLSQKWTEMIVG